MKTHTNDNTEKIIRQYSDTVYRLAFARTGNKSDSDDIFQEVFLRYVKKHPVFNSEEHRKAWFIRVTVNCCNNVFSSLWRKNTVELTEDIPFETDEQLDLFFALQKLPDRYRDVVHLFYYEDMSVKEIADALTRKESTVRTQLTRARNMLKDILKEDDYV